MLDLNPEQCNNTHLHGNYICSKKFLKPILTKFFIITVDKSGVIGIHITFQTAIVAPYQLLAYAVYPKIALIDSAGDCKLIDNI